MFGPRQRSYAKDLNKKMRRLAIRSALSSKVADGQLVLVDRLAFDTPRTKEMIRILKNVGIERSVLVVTGEADRMVLASVRNLQKTKALPAAYLNVVDMLNYNKILITEDAVRVAEQLWGSRVPVPAPDKAKAPSRKPAAKAEAADAPAPAPAPAKPAPGVRAKTEAPAEEKPEAAPAPKAPPRRAAAKAEKAPAPEAEAKPARRARAPKAEAPAEAAPEAETKPRRRVKKTEGEG